MIHLQSQLVNMKVWIVNKRGNTLSFNKFVTIVLFCYFGFVIYKANEKLQTRAIGTIFKTVSGAKTVKVSISNTLLIMSSGELQYTVPFL